MQLVVDNPEGFVTDPAVRTAMRSGISAVAGVPASWVTVTMSLGRLRRLASRGDGHASQVLTGRSLQSSTVTVDYVISIPSDYALDVTAHVQSVQSSLNTVSSTAMAAVIEAEISAQAGSGTFSFTVADMSSPTVEGEVETTPTTTETSQVPPRVDVIPMGETPDTTTANSRVFVLAMMCILGASGVIFACILGSSRARKKACHYPGMCCGERCGCMVPLQPPDQRDLAEDDGEDSDECDVRVDVAIPFENGHVPMSIVRNMSPMSSPRSRAGGSDSDSPSEPEMEVDELDVVDVDADDARLRPSLMSTLPRVPSKASSGMGPVHDNILSPPRTRRLRVQEDEESPSSSSGEDVDMVIPASPSSVKSSSTSYCIDDEICV
jgi:hypothetical protein